MTTIDASLASARRAFAAYPSLKGKCAFVTGGATGIGAAMVQAYADQGVTVGFIDIAEEQGQQLCQQIIENMTRLDAPYEAYRRFGLPAPGETA